MNPLVGGPFAMGMLWLRALKARSTGHLSPIIFLVLGLALGPTAGAQIQCEDFLISGGAGRLHVRELRDHRDAKPKNLILLHGGGPGGVPSFDLPVPGYSLAEDFAKRGFRVFVMDVRGWGSSTKPRAMDQPPQNSAPLVSTKEAADDIATVVNWVVRRTHEKTEDGQAAVTGRARMLAADQRL